MARIASSETRLGFFFLCIVLAWVTSAYADGNTTATPTPTPTLSGCQVCASTGDCSHAYLDAPGQFCGNWLDKASQRQRCCCPREAVCRVSNYECRCSMKTPTPAPAKAVSTGGWAGVGVGGFMFLACCTGACWCMHRAITRNRNNQRPPQATAVPMVYGQPPCNVVPVGAPGVAYGAPPGYGAPPVHYPYAGVPTAPAYGYGYGNSYSSHHHSSGLSTGLGAVAGLVTGMVVADAVFDGGHHGDYGGGGGYDGGGGGGYDGGGDSGGGGGGDFGGDF